MRRRTLLFAAPLLALAACGGQTPAYAPIAQAPTLIARPAAPAKPVLSTTAPAGTRVALLAPLTGANAERGQALVTAAKLALSDPGSPALDVFDTASTQAGAASAAEQAIAAGAGIIIGPLTAAETAAAATPALAAGVPMLPFTNDSAQARPGVWPLGLTAPQQVRRLVASLAAQGRTRFAAVLPQSDFGNAMAAALASAVADAGLPAADIRFHSGGMSAANTVMRDISGYATRRAPLDAQIKAARALHTPEGRKRAAELVRQPIPAAPIDALLLADFGEPLHTLTSLLSYYDIDAPKPDATGVRIFGPAQWATPAALGEAALNGAYYAAPDPALRAAFDAKYTAATGNPAPGLADFAYDAAAIARVLATSGEGYSPAALGRPEGFAGVNGVLALLPDGRVRRGLAVFQIQRGGATLTDPAPDTLAAPGI